MGESILQSCDNKLERKWSMSSGLLSMGDAGGVERAVPTLGVGMLGYAFMGKAHTNAYKKLDYIYTPPPAHASLVAIGGSDATKVAAAARRYGYAKAVTDWRAIIDDPDIQV